MDNKDFTVKREANDHDLSFEQGKEIEFLSNDRLNDFYDGIKGQLTTLFVINIVFCSLAAIVILVGAYMILFARNAITGTVLSLSGLLSEMLGNLFISQYRTALNKVSDEYYRLLLCNNMNKALNFAKQLPLVDMSNRELRYLEVREILRAIMKNFDQHIASK